eukprot:1841920-Prymnesium_polylepis.1
MLRRTAALFGPRSLQAHAKTLSDPNKLIGTHAHAASRMRRASSTALAFVATLAVVDAYPRTDGSAPPLLQHQPELSSPSSLD